MLDFVGHSFLAESENVGIQSPDKASVKHNRKPDWERVKNMGMSVGTLPLTGLEPCSCVFS